MSSISESSAAGQKLLQSGVLKYVEPIAAPPAIPAPIAAYPAAPSQYLRAPLPDDFWQQPDAQRQFHAAAIPQTRISPLPDNTNPVAGAQAASQAISIVQNTPATTSAGGVTSVGLTAPSIFVSPVAGSPVTSAGTLALALANEPVGTVFAGPATTGGNISVDFSVISTGGIAPSTPGGAPATFNGFSSTTNDFALLAVPGNAIAETASNPTGWTVINTIPAGFGNGGVFWKIINAVGSFTAISTITNNNGSNPNNYGSVLVTLKATGTPAVQQLKNQGITGQGVGQATSIVMPSNTLAGSTMLLIAEGNAQTSAGFAFDVRDSQGNVYTPIGTVSYVNFTRFQQATVYAAPSTTAAALTITATNTVGAVIGNGVNFTALEVTNVSVPSFTPTFRPLVQSDIPGLPASKIASGQVALTQGGTAADLSATGGTHQFLRQNSSGAAITVVQPDYTDLAGVALPTKFNNITLVSNGLPSEVAKVDLTAQTATITTTTLYAVPAAGAGQYRLNWNAKVTTAAGVSSTLGALTIVYTDPDGVAQTITAAAQNSAGTIETTDTGNSTTTVMLGLPLVLNCKASTNITYAFAYASNAAAAMNFNLHMKLESL